LIVAIHVFSVYDLTAGHWKFTHCASAMVIHYEEALYQVFAPLPFTFAFIQ